MAGLGTEIRRELVPQDCADELYGRSTRRTGPKWYSNEVMCCLGSGGLCSRNHGIVLSWILALCSQNPHIILWHAGIYIHFVVLMEPHSSGNCAFFVLASVTEPISAMAKRARWRLLGHILRQPSSTPGNQAMIAYASMEDAVRHRRGAPRSCLVTTLQQDVKFTAVALKTSRHLETLRSCAVDRQKWSNICSAVV